MNPDNFRSRSVMPQLPLMPENINGSVELGTDGLAREMTLRDWFAGMTLPLLQGSFPDTTYEQDAASAYRMADAMLKERSKA